MLRSRRPRGLLPALGGVVLATVALGATPVAGARTGSAAWSSVTSQSLGARVVLSSAAFSSQGDGLLAFARLDKDGYPTTLEDEHAPTVIRPVDRLGHLGRSFSLPASQGRLVTGAIAGGRALVLRSPDDATSPIALSELSRAGRVSRRQPIAAPHRLRASASICASSRGDAVILWTERKGHGPATLAMARRPARGTISHRAPLTTTTVWTETCAVNAAGRWAVAAAVTPIRGNTTVPRLQVWTGDVRHATASMVDLGTAPYSTGIDVAVDGAGRTYVITRSQLPGTSFNASDEDPFRVRSATVAADGHTTTAQQPVLTGFGDGGDAAVAASPTTGATLELSSGAYDANGSEIPPTVSFATADAGGTVGPLSAPLPNATTIGQAFYRSGAAAMLTWSTGTERHDHIDAAEVSAGGLGAVQDTGLTDNLAPPAITADGSVRLFSVRTGGTGDSRLLSTTLGG